jgi:hypothetical protein
MRPGDTPPSSEAAPTGKYRPPHSHRRSPFPPKKNSIFRRYVKHHAPCRSQRRPENRVGLREIRRVSRREISQAGRDALVCARFSFWARFNFLVNPTGSRMYGGGSCNPSVLRSYFAPAWRASADMVRQRGAVRRTRGARAPHSGQADGSSHSAIARICVNGPHFLHIYSYVGIDHLPLAQAHLAADHPPRLWQTIPVASRAVNASARVAVTREPAAGTVPTRGARADTRPSSPRRAPWRPPFIGSRPDWKIPTTPQSPGEPYLAKKFYNSASTCRPRIPAPCRSSRAQEHNPEIF